MSPHIKALIALVITGTLGGIAPIFMKIAFSELSPVHIAFTRFFFAFLMLLPYAFIKKQLAFKLKDVPQIVCASILFSGNILLFVIGLQYTTSVASQLLYLLLPVFVLLWSFLFLRQRIQQKHVVSIVLGLLGGIILLLRGHNDRLINSLGSPTGNVIILTAVISWSFYIIVSKGLSNKYHPLTLLIMNSLTTALISGFLLIIFNIPIFQTYTALSFSTGISLIYLICMNSILFFFLYQWAIKHVKPYSVSMSAYLSPLAAASIAIPFFGEQVSVQLIISALCIGASAYLAFKNR